MSTPTSAHQGSIEKSEGRKWACTICPATRTGRRTFGTFKAALNHQRTVHDNEPPTIENDKDTNGPDDSHDPENHPPTPPADKTGWARIDPKSYTRLTSDGLRQWEMHAHVDHVSDLVPFWQHGVEAAAKGKVLRLEEFLDKMEEDGGWRNASEVLEMMGVWKAPPSESGCDNPTDRGWTADPNEWATNHRTAWETEDSGWTTGQEGGLGMTTPRITSDETELSHGENSGLGLREAWADGGTDFNTGQANCSAPPPDGWGNRARGKSVQAVRGGRKKGKLQFVNNIARQQAVDGERQQQMHRFFEMSTEKKVEKIEETIRLMRTHTKA
ncbi:hypothetical protein JVU11DRAFT_5034 [Chiua virens]|nr:hypothetical protein JVU11DRAFT_5034 [Chiua virens]